MKSIQEQHLMDRVNKLKQELEQKKIEYENKTQLITIMTEKISAYVSQIQTSLLSLQELIDPLIIQDELLQAPYEIKSYVDTNNYEIIESSPVTSEGSASGEILIDQQSNNLKIISVHSSFMSSCSSTEEFLGFSAEQTPKPSPAPPSEPSPEVTLNKTPKMTARVSNRKRRQSTFYDSSVWNVGSKLTRSRSLNDKADDESQRVLCLVCHKVFQNGADLGIHERAHRFSCEICQKTYKRENFLRTHMKKFH